VFEIKMVGLEAARAFLHGYNKWKGGELTEIDEFGGDCDFLNFSE